MTPENFCYWLQGWFELNSTTNNTQVTPETITVIKNHLNMVFAHSIDPSQGDAAHQEVLNKLHFNTNQGNLSLLTEESTPKPPDWDGNWEFSDLYGWYNPLQGKPRC